jgi:aminomethyltransferase
MSLLRLTPFHECSAAANRGNLWCARNGVSVAAQYDDANAEALAVRTGAVLTDISWHWRVRLEGARVGEFLVRLLTHDARMLLPGESARTLWLADGGGVRGEGIIARESANSFLLVSSCDDREWVAAGAHLFGVTTTILSDVEGALAIIGPYAHAVLAAAGFGDAPPPLAFRKCGWRGYELAISRFGAGIEFSCAAANAAALWEQLLRAGASSGLVPAGLLALDILNLEAGAPQPGLDYTPARAGHARKPLPRALGLQSLVDERNRQFNGRGALLAAAPESRSLMGVEIDANSHAPNTPVMTGERVIGRTLYSVYSPALRRAIALAQIEKKSTKPGLPIWLEVAPAHDRPEFTHVGGSLARLPFLPIAAPIPLRSAHPESA